MTTIDTKNILDTSNPDDYEEPDLDDEPEAAEIETDDVIDADDVSSNPAGGDSLADVIARQVSRRTVLGGGPAAQRAAARLERGPARRR